MNAPTMMERIWKTRIKKAKKTSFLVLIFSMIAPAIFLR